MRLSILGANFFLIMKREDIIRPVGTSQDSVERTGLTFDGPADPEQSSQDQA